MALSSKAGAPRPELEDLTRVELNHRVHLLGLGAVGRAFLDAVAATSYVICGVSDRTATVFSTPEVLREAVALKVRGSSLSGHPASRSIPPSVLARIFPVGVVVDATDSSPHSATEAWARTQSLLAGGKRVVLAAKNAVLEGAPAIFDPDLRDRVGVNAVLGGTGRRLQASIDTLRARTDSVAAVPNATSTALVEAIEDGSTFDEALESCRRRGLTEEDASLDLDGVDAWTKASIVARAVFPDSDAATIRATSFERCDSRSELDPELLRHRLRNGETTRLIARIDRSTIRVRYEAVQRTGALAVSSRRVAYDYHLRGGARTVHVGSGLGPVGTASALIEDLSPSRSGEER
ncbi:MAG: hypothetical protein AAF488_01235 [Planctomycetota bacterium]